MRNRHGVTHSLLTLFTTCKPFVGEFSRIQRNAITSWSRLRPSCDILIFGNEPGVGDCCREVGARQVAEVPRSDFGTPLLNGLFSSAEQATKSELLGCVNADIMLTSDLWSAIETVRRSFSRFLLIARRWNVTVDCDWDFDARDWETRLQAYARTQGDLEPIYGGMDVFVYPRGMWQDLPPFAIGRGRWDSALIYQARIRDIPVIDATDRIVSVHQNHGYGHHPQHSKGVFKGPESVRNFQLLGGEEYIFSALNATHVLTSAGLRRRIVLFPPHFLRKLATLPALYPSLGLLTPVVRLMAPVWRGIRTMRDPQRRRHGGT